MTDRSPGHRSPPRRRGHSVARAPVVTAPHRLDPSALGDHADRLLRDARALTRCQTDAEDLVQDAYLRVLTKPRYIHGEDDIGYLRRVLRNTFISQRRRAARRPQTQRLDDTVELADPRTGLRPGTAAEARLVLELISALPPDARDVVLAVDVIGLSHEEAARLLGTKRATIATRLFRARRRVAGTLEGAPVGA